MAVRVAKRHNYARLDTITDSCIERAYFMESAAMLQMQASNVAIDDHSVISLGRRHVVLHHRVTECDRAFPSPPETPSSSSSNFL